MKEQIQIDLCRLSLIWIETNLRLLGNPKPPNLPLGFLGNRDSYAAEFNKIQQRKSTTGLAVPWPKPGHHFWEYYLERTPGLDQMTGARAWKFQVPLRGNVAIGEVTVPSLKGRIGCESFFYPFGFGLIITFTQEKSQSFSDVVELMFKIKKAPILHVTWESGAQDTLGLDQFADKCLASIRKVAFGQPHPAGTKSGPFTVFTVLKGSGQNLSAPIVYGSDIQRMLEAVTCWPANWLATKLPALDEKIKLPLRSATNDADLVYARERGRAIWFPTLFTYPVARTSLSCYHRNTVMAALQTESLCGLTTATAKAIKNGDWASRSVMHRDCGQLTAGILGRMYGGDKDTYRSMSARYHITQNQFETNINLVRKKHGMEPLS